MVSLPAIVIKWNIHVSMCIFVCVCVWGTVIEGDRWHANYWVRSSGNARHYLRRYPSNGMLIIFFRIEKSFNSLRIFISRDSYTFNFVYCIQCKNTLIINSFFVLRIMSSHDEMKMYLRQRKKKETLNTDKSIFF